MCSYCLEGQGLNSNQSVLCFTFCLRQQLSDPSWDQEVKMSKTTALGIDSHVACTHPALPVEELEPGHIPRQVTPSWTGHQGPEFNCIQKEKQMFHKPRLTHDYISSTCIHEVTAWMFSKCCQTPIPIDILYLYLFAVFFYYFFYISFGIKN